MSRSRLSFQSSINSVIESLESRRLRSADLTAEFSSAIPAELNAADNNHLAIRVINEGDISASGKVNVSLYLSPQPGTEAGGDMLLATASKSMNLKPGHGRNIGLRFAEPAGAPDGNYSLFADVNSSAIANAVSTDDVVTTQSLVIVTQPGPDLTPISIKAPMQPIVISDTGTLGQVAKASILNHGKAIADGNATLQFYLSTDSQLDSGDTLAATIKDAPILLKPGQREQFSALLVPDSSTPAGDYFLLAVVRPGGGIVQQNRADEIGIAARQVLVVREYQTIPPDEGTDAGGADVGTTIEIDVPGADDSGQGGNDNSTTPSDATQPTTQPATQPTTQPTTQPCGDGSGSDTSSTDTAQCTPPDNSDTGDNGTSTDTSGNQSSSDSSSDSSSVSSADQGASTDPASDGGSDSTSDSTDSTSTSTDDSQSNSPDPSQSDPSQMDPGSTGNSLLDDSSDSNDQSTGSDDSQTDPGSADDSGQDDSSSADSSDGTDASSDYSWDDSSGD